MTLQAGTRLGPYEILSPLGAGGMGEVYRARDSKLKREVAVKVLPQTLAADPDALARFEREAVAVAALSHPNILSIFDFGTQDETAYAVMELLEGETLRGKLDAGPIPQKQAVDYALQIAKGLSAAHDKGVVHRDLKPENLFVTNDGHLKILDFGLAKKVGTTAPGEQTSAPTVSGHTEPGTVMGTVGYMSPEQVRGLPVEHRSDIFSLGTILYELLSGKKPFSRPTVADTMSAILKEDPPELLESQRKISPVLDRIVKHCLEKDRERRFQSAHDIAFALSEASRPATSPLASPAPSAGIRKSRIAVAAVVVVLAAGAVFLLRRPQVVRGEAGGAKRIAVLPFENLGGPEDDYFADGIADEVRGKLTALSGVEVIARSSSTPYRKTTKTPRQIAQELGVRYLLTATVRWQKGTGVSRVHVSPELVEVRDSGAPANKWQQPFDAALTDVFQVQSDIASRVAQALGVALGASEEKRLGESPTQNVVAYDAFLKGVEAYKSGAGMDLASLRKQLGFYEQAVALDPGFARAWASLSMVCSKLYWATPTPDLKERARKGAETARALAPESPSTYQALAGYQRFILNDHQRALELLAEGLRRAPADPGLLESTGSTERNLGRWEAAVAHLQQAQSLDPRSVRGWVFLSDALLCMRRLTEARETADRGLALAPADFALAQIKAKTFLAQGDLAGAGAVFRTVAKAADATALVAQMASQNLGWALDEQQRELLLRLTPTAFDEDRGAWALALADAYAPKGDAANVRTHAEEARKAMEKQLLSTPDEAWFVAQRGIALAYLGRKEEAIREGRRALELLPLAKDAEVGASLQHQLVRIYILVGEPERALEQLEPLLKMGYWLTPDWLRIDPTFDPLRANPRFQKLVAGK